MGGEKFYGNDIAIASDGEMVVSNYQPDASITHTLEAALFGSLTGEVRAWNKEQGWRLIDGTSASMANGVAVSRNGKMLFYTETMTGLLYRVPRAQDHGAVSVTIGGNPDNLTWTKRGTL